MLVAAWWPMEEQAVRVQVAWYAIIVWVCCSLPGAAQQIELGRLLAETYCSDCHASGAEGESPFPAAPPFRSLPDRYDVRLLEEALVEGLVTGHPAMPEFEFEPHQARAIIDYLESLAASGDEQSATPQRGASATFGELTFGVYCAGCHGADGQGGAAAAAMFEPSDLTRLAVRNGGSFPADRVRRIIDGREEVVGHTGVAMPPWARLFAHELELIEDDAQREELIALRIADLVSYLATIQRR